MKLRTVIEQPSLTVELSNGMSVTIYDVGGGALHPHVVVCQKSRDLLNGAPSAPDTPRYDIGGGYSFSLPDVSEIGRTCSAFGADPASADFPSEGKATITVSHRH